MPTEHQLESPEFRQHIRTLLYQYSKTHLTTDFVTFTEDLVSELLQDLRPIPLTDPYSFVVPVDPFQTFSQIHSLSSLAPYDEILPTTKEAIACIKSLTGSKPGPPITSRLHWTESTYEPLPEPMYPALTRRSRKTTPKLGKQANQAPSDNFRTLADNHGFVVATIEPVAEEKLDIEDILRVKHQIDAEELSAVKSVLKSTADAMRKKDAYKNKYLEPSFLCKIDYDTYEVPEEEFLPIFPRKRAYPPPETAKNAKSVRSFYNYMDILPMINKTVKVEDIDGSLPHQHLVLVDGWEAIQSSPPSTPSSKNTDSEDQQDQLFFESSPNTEPPLVEEIIKSRMDILIPLSRQIGGKSGITPHILAGKTMQNFLYPLLQKGTNNPSACGVDKQDQRRDSPTDLSLVGHAASELGVSDAESSSAWANNHDRDLNLELEKIYGGHGLDNMIMKETLDEKQDMLMEVPSLPEPNVHPPSGFHVPKGFVEFLIPSAKVEAGQNKQNLANPEAQHQFLRKVRGKQLLQLELSWVTFTVDERLPSVFELVGVNDLFKSSKGADEAEKIIKSTEIMKEHELCFSWSQNTLYSPPETQEEFKVLLTRQERMRLAKMEGRSEEKVLNSSDEDVNDRIIEDIDTQAKEGEEMNIDVSMKRSSSGSRKDSEMIPKSSYHTDYPDNQDLHGASYGNDGRMDGRRPAKRPRLEAPLPTVYLEPDFSCPIPNSVMNPSTDSGDSGYPFPQIFSEENKENYPPFSSSWPIEEQEQTFEELWESAIEYNQPLEAGQVSNGAESFEALSLDSSYPYNIEWNIHPSDLSTGDMPPVLPRGQGEKNISRIGPRTLIVSNGQLTPSTTTESASQLLLQSAPEIAFRSLGISAFAALRARNLSKPKSSSFVPPAPDPVCQAPAIPPQFQQRRGVPLDLLDQNTMVLSEPVAEQRSIHRYMASLDFIQKRGLVHALRSEECAVELVERQTLGGVDIIVDPDCAVIFFSLFTLPARCEVYVQRVAEQSWKYSHLLVVFEAYPDSLATRSKPRESSELELNVFTPPIIKAIKKFRRDVSIADACGTKRVGAKILYAFADSVRDAALVTRAFGSKSEERDETSGVIWGERSWLAVDFAEEEERLLAGVKGMNPFSASIILCQISLEDFVELLPEERLERFCGLLSEEVISECSADIESRLQAMLSSSDADALSSTGMTF